MLAAAPAAASAPPLLDLLRRLDGVRQLLEGEANPPLVRVDADDQEGQLVTDADQLVGPADRAVGHLRDVQEPVNAGLELDERAEVGETHDLSGDPRSHRKTLCDGRPRIRLHLLEPERDPLVLAVEVEDLRLELLALLEDLG